MISSNAFDYINVLDKAADAAALRNELISNNIANQDTPNYKRQDVNFEAQLTKALHNSKYISIDDKVANLRNSALKPRQYTDYENYSYRLDGNNVDPEQEQVMLAANQLKYQGLTKSINAEFSNLSMVMK
ncbi:MAG: flagellar basal body rod protein FlgB [Lachnospiraceae bacterium]|nr:flagellar basal body rod protein FlgB [Lachnospiraceae bacterium]